ncbi:uncharacterized protein [Rutidosis leptorrhynchoides]|uniref:uncharacterized protein n=1 Tax=Rutidosis leptorrhynchoides TaxID=125765 RepID=UPI003A9A2746
MDFKIKRIGKKHSHHRIAESKLSDLMNQYAHLRRRYEKRASHKDKETRVQVKVAVHLVRWLAFQGCIFRGHDERKELKRQGNFQALLNSLSTYNEDVSTSIASAPQNAIYNSPTIQKQILHTMSRRVKEVIREEIGNAKYCILVDEVQDESKKEQMSIILRFVDKNGYVQERFFGLVHVKDIAASTLRNDILFVLSQHNLDVQNIQGQGYDGAIAASKEVILIHQFFTKLSSIIIIVGVSYKYSDQLKAVHAENIAHLLAINELKSRTGLNQVYNL